MKLKNYRPRPMREVEYFGVKISIPAGIIFVATDASGHVYGYENPPAFSPNNNDWRDEEANDDEGYFLGAVDPISAEDAENSLHHYPVGDNK